MSKKVVLIVMVFFLFFSLQAQRLNKKRIDDKTQKEILVGKCNLKGLKTGEFGDVFKIEYTNYHTDSNVIVDLQKKMKKIKIEIVLGTWCGDSKEQVPRFIKILDELRYKTRKLEIVSITRLFEADGFNKMESNVIKVPTFIIYRKNIEIGRIIETPMQTLEKDLLNILNK
jgi:thiol-disulfide isomerase/thioredoxin